MNPNDIFWLARYAFNAINPLVKEDERLQIILNMGGKFPGVQVWVFGGEGEVTSYRTYLTKWEEVEAFANQLKTREEALV